jgi:hypothetical protein
MILAETVEYVLNRKISSTWGMGKYTVNVLQLLKDPHLIQLECTLRGANGFQYRYAYYIDVTMSQDEEQIYSIVNKFYNACTDVLRQREGYNTHYAHPSEYIHGPMYPYFNMPSMSQSSATTKPLFKSKKSKKTLLLC